MSQFNSNSSTATENLDIAHTWTENLDIAHTWTENLDIAHTSPIAESTFWNSYKSSSATMPESRSFQRSCDVIGKN